MAYPDIEVKPVSPEFVRELDISDWSAPNITHFKKGEASFDQNPWYVACQNDVVVAVASLWHEPSTVWLEHLHVKTSGLGVGTAFMAWLEEQSEGYGYKTIALQAVDTSHRFYENLGYRRVPTQTSRYEKRLRKYGPRTNSVYTCLRSTGGNNRNFDDGGHEPRGVPGRVDTLQS